MTMTLFWIVVALAVVGITSSILEVAQLI